MTTQETISALVENGGREWQKGDLHRVYFNAAAIARLAGYEWETYNTGNLCTASLDGDAVSNNEMFKVLGALNDGKFWYDVPTGKFWSKCISTRAKNAWGWAVSKLRKLISEE